MIIRKIKKFFYNRGLDRKINYIEKFATGKCSYKDIDPELDAILRRKNKIATVRI